MYFASFLALVGSLVTTALAAESRSHPRAFDLSSSLNRRAPPTGQLITRCTTPGQVALTYDDGPWSFTSDLLDTLDDLGVKATFFLVGDNFERRMDEAPWADIVRRAYDAGHHLATHTWDHPDLETVSSEERASQLARNDDAFRNIIGVAPRYFRAPFLSCGAECVAQIGDLGYYVIDTNLDTKDFENNTPDTIQVSKDKFDAELGSDPGSDDFIVLAHDVHETTVTELTPHMVATLQERGFEAVTVGECLGDPQSNWYRD